MRPKSSSLTFIWRKSIAFTVPFEISISYCSPVRLSVTDSVSWAVATPPPFSLCVCSSAMAPLSLVCPVPDHLPGTLRVARVRQLSSATRASVARRQAARAGAHALRRRGLGRGVRAAARRARAARPRVVRRLARLPIALLGLGGLGSAARPPDEVEQRGDRHLQREHHPQEHPAAAAHRAD